MANRSGGVRALVREAWAFLEGFWRALWRIRPGNSPEEKAFLDELLAQFPFSDEASGWLRETVRVQIGDLGSLRGGGLFFPGQNRVYLNSSQYEAAIHELAHAWWDVRRRLQRDELIAAVSRAAEEPDPQYGRIARLAHGYIHGIPEVGFPGFLQDRNDWEMFAGLASGCMADIRLLPPYLRPFFEGLFDLLPEDAPSPEEVAPHR
jgi:hypothetical protein